MASGQGVPIVPVNVPTLIPRDQLTELQPAADVKNVAENASEIHETQSIAYAINTAANTGATSVIYDKEISDNVQSTLELNGYVLTPRAMANNHASYIISWA
jgi:hypothetical protein